LRSVRLQADVRRPAEAGGYVLAALIVGLLIRVAALSFPGTGDVTIWKTWAYNAATIGTSRLYGVGGSTAAPSQYQLLRFGDFEAIADYPPLSLYALGIAGSMYQRAAGSSFPDTAALTMTIKAVPVVFEAALCVLLFVVLRRTAGDAPALWAVVAYWLNPAAIINASFGGYLDALFVLPAVGSLMCATAGRPLLAGGLIAASVLTKPQGIFIVPAVAIALWNSGQPGARCRRMTMAGLGAGVVVVAIAAPFLAAGAWWNMVHGVGSQANEIYLSMEGYNFWWMAGHFLWVAYAWQRGLDAWAVFVGPVTRIPFVRAAAHGLPFLRVAGTLLALAGIAWGISIGRRARDLSLVAAVGAFSVHAYAVLGAQVHENHLFAAMPLLVIAAATRRRYVPVLAGVSAFLALSMLFYIFSDQEGRWLLSRSFTLLDTTLLLAVFNCGLFVWHGAVLRAEADG
jgi:hypothetical protein